MKASLYVLPFLCFAGYCSLGAVGQSNDDSDMSCASPEGCSAAESPSVLQASSQKSQVKVKIPIDPLVKKKRKSRKGGIIHPEHDVHQEARFPGLLQEMTHLKGKSQRKVGARLDNALASLRLQQDLSKLSKEHYLDYSVNLSHQQNCYKTFEHFAKVFNLSQELTREEDATFGQRFCEDIITALEAAGASMSGVVWKDLIATRLEAEKPAVYEALVRTINNAKAGMRAAIQDWMLNMSVEDMNRRHGDRVTDETEDHHEEAVASLLDVRGRAPAEFDARDKWPECKPIFERVRDQGNCGSCWAFAASQTVDHRLCVHGKGRHGPNDAVSAGYIAWCYDMDRGGCNGGDAWNGIKETGKNGVPSGLGVSGCVPYDMSGNARNHFGGSGGDKSQQCPTSCTNSNYAKSLRDDTWIPKGYQNALQIINSNSVKQTAKEALFSGGPIGFSVKCNSAWNSYSSGVYNPGCYQRSNHAVLAIGYDSTTFLAVNSYGPSWGMNGRFKIADCGPHRFYYPTALATDAVFPEGTGAGTGGSGGTDTCEYASDGECDVPEYCDAGTDCTDCGDCSGADDDDSGDDSHDDDSSSAAPDDSCEYSKDGACDVPEYCDAGTDCTDCGDCGGADDDDSGDDSHDDDSSSAAPDDSCEYSKDGECDEPEYCDAGTDCSDCGSCSSADTPSPTQPPTLQPTAPPTTSPTDPDPAPQPKPTPTRIPTALPTPIRVKAERLSQKVAAEAEQLETDTACLKNLLKGQECA